jgi:hypothetical protein
MYKYRETTKDTNYDDCCSIRRFRFGTWTISGHFRSFAAQTARQIPYGRSTIGERLAGTETSVFVAEERERRRTFGIQELKDRILAGIDESPPTSTHFP